MLGSGLIAFPAIGGKTGILIPDHYMRLDTHIHILSGGKKLDELERYLMLEGITHAVMLFRTNDLEFLPRVQKMNACIIPFHRPANPLEPFVDPDPESPILGYKIHLRHPVVINKAGQPVAADDEGLYPMCSAAEKVGRPFLFHTDADDPKLCSIPRLANLAGRFTLTNFIAAHWPFYSQEYQADALKQEDFEYKAPAVLKESIDILLDVKNLYGDVALLGRDFPERTNDPDFKLKLLKTEVEKMSRVKKRAILNKLFIGTDFPGFYKKQDEPRIGYHFQKECMTLVFGKDFNETKMTRNFLDLLPLNHKRKVRFVKHWM